MRTGVTIFVAVAVALMVVTAVLFGMDLYAAIILLVIMGLGWLAMAAARRSESGRFGPVACPACGGLISPNAPHCKHCGELREPGREEEEA